MCIYIQNKWCTVNCSPPTNWCPASSQAAAAHQTNSPQFSGLFFFFVDCCFLFVCLFVFAWCQMVWNIPLASVAQLSWFCPHPAPSAPAAALTGRTVQETEKLKHSWLCAALLSNNWNTAVLSRLFFSQSQNIAPWGKSQFCSRWNHDTVVHLLMTGVCICH